MLRITIFSKLVVQIERNHRLPCFNQLERRLKERIHYQVMPNLISVILEISLKKRSTSKMRIFNKILKVKGRRLLFSNLARSCLGEILTYPTKRIPYHQLIKEKVYPLIQS